MTPTTTELKPKRRYRSSARKAEPCIVCEDAPTMDRVCNYCVKLGLAHKCRCGEWTANRGRVCTGCLRRAGL
jgi:hypothetical protein